MATPIRIVETNEQALRRLLKAAQESGVRILRDDAGDWYATSASEPALLHRVALDACSCRGFLAHRRCRHVAMLLDHLGRLPDPDPTPSMRITCAHFEGHYGLEDAPQWHAPQTDLLVDGKVKVRITGDTCDLSVWWIEGGRPIDDLTGCTPAYLDHGGVVDYWLHSLGAEDHAAHRNQRAEVVDPIAA